MTITTRKASLGGLATLGVVALLAGCASAPEESGGGSGAAPADSDFLPCMVSDSGGFNDASFNQLGKEGLDDAADELGVEPNAVQSDAETDFGPNLTNLVNQGCSIIVTVGFLLADATKAAAEENADVQFAIIDDASIDADNVKPLTFNTSEAAFLAGYAAASYSKTGIVGTFGGLQIPTVTIFMDGYADGVEYYNEQKGADVKVIGWDEGNQKGGSFSNSFTDQAAGRSITETLAGQGADIIMPVAGQAGLGAGAAAEAAGGKLNLIWVDTDGCVSAEQYCDYFISSVTKNLTKAVTEYVDTAAGGTFPTGGYIGNLKNDGTGLAPFNKFDAQVPAELKTELDTVKAGIIAGTIKITSPSAIAAG